MHARRKYHYLQISDKGAAEVWPTAHFHKTHKSAIRMTSVKNGIEKSHVAKI